MVTDIRSLHPPVVATSDMNGPSDKCSGSLFVFYNAAVTHHVARRRQRTRDTTSIVVRPRRRQPLSPGRDSPVAIVTVTQTWAPGLSPKEASFLT